MMNERCKHCHEPIRQVAVSGWWTHEDELIGIYCQTTTAEPLGSK